MGVCVIEQMLSDLRKYNSQKTVQLEHELQQNQRRLCKMQVNHFSQMLRIGNAAERERAIEGLLSIKGSPVVSVLANHLVGETDVELREKILDAIESCIKSEIICESFTQMRTEELPVSVLAIYATNLANNYTHTLLAA